MEVTWYTDGSSFMQDGRRHAGAAVTTKEEVIWAELMPTGTFTKQAELTALTKELELEGGWTVNVYTDSRYAFATAHVYIQRKGTANCGRKTHQK